MTNSTKANHIGAVHPPWDVEARNIVGEDLQYFEAYCRSFRRTPRIIYVCLHPARPDFNRMMGLYYTIGFRSQYQNLKNNKWTIQGPDISIELDPDREEG